MRATRVGGSLSSFARACGATNIKKPVRHNRSPSLLLLMNVIVFMTNPLFSERTLDCRLTVVEGVLPMEALYVLASIILNPGPGKKLPFDRETHCRSGC